MSTLYSYPFIPNLLFSKRILINNYLNNYLYYHINHDEIYEFSSVSEIIFLSLLNEILYKNPIKEISINPYSDIVNITKLTKSKYLSYIPIVDKLLNIFSHNEGNANKYLRYWFYDEDRENIYNIHIIYIKIDNVNTLNGGELENDDFYIISIEYDKSSFKIKAFICHLYMLNEDFHNKSESIMKSVLSNISKNDIHMMNSNLKQFIREFIINFTKRTDNSNLSLKINCPSLLEFKNIINHSNIETPTNFHINQYYHSDYKSITNYSYIDMKSLINILPFTEKEFSQIKRQSYSSLLERDKQNKNTAFQLCFDELQKRVNSELNESQINFFDKWMLVRYSIGFNANIERAWMFIKEYIKYSENHIKKLLGMSQLEINNKYDSFYMNEFINIIGNDIYGRPVFFIKAKDFNPKKISKENLVDIMIIKLESVISKLPLEIDKILVIIDISQRNSSNLSIPHLKEVQDVMNKCYIERLSNVIVINKTFFFNIMWKIVSSVLPKRVIQKVIVVDEKNKKEVIRIIGDEVKERIGLK